MKNNFISPFKNGCRVTQAFGRGHGGMDICPLPDESGDVYAVADGVVSMVVNLNVHYSEQLKANRTREWGTFIKISSPNFVAFYCHLKYLSPIVKVGDKVSAGQKIAFYGNTGYSFGAHLHLEIRDNFGGYIYSTPVVTLIPNELGIYKNQKDEENEPMTPEEKKYYDSEIAELSKYAKENDMNIKGIQAVIDSQNYQFRNIAEIKEKMSWAAEAIDELVADGFISGVAEDNLGLTANEIRMLVIIHRIYKAFKNAKMKKKGK